MRRLPAIAFGALLLMTASCGSDSPPTPVAAPTVAGIAADLEQPATAIQVQVVLAGLAQDALVPMHALPGIDQPVIAEIGAGDQVTSLDQLFETEDGMQWIQIQAVSMQGWIPHALSYQGPAIDITEQTLASLDSNTFGSAEEAASMISSSFAAAQGGPATIVTVSQTSVAGTDSTTIVTDVTGEPNAVALGSRLTIALSSTDGWAPVSVFQSVLCVQGVDAQGRCI